MIVARLFGGEEDGWDCSVISVQAYVVTIDGVRKSFTR